MGALGSAHIPSKFQAQGSNPEGLPQVAPELRQMCMVQEVSQEPQTEKESFLHGVIQDVLLHSFSEILHPLCVSCCPAQITKMRKPGISAPTELCWGGPSSQLPKCGRDAGFQPVSLNCWCLLCCFDQHRHAKVLDGLQFGLLTSAIERQGVG